MPQICSLKDKTCKPCEGDETLKFNNKQIKEHLSQVKDWKIKNSKLYKEFKFKNFKQALDFVNQIGNISEQEQHHPNIKINYNKVSIELYTHAINGLSENDFILSAKINNIQ